MKTNIRTVEGKLLVGIEAPGTRKNLIKIDMERPLLKVSVKYPKGNLMKRKQETAVINIEERYEVAGPAEYVDGVIIIELKMRDGYAPAVISFSEQSV